MLEDVELRELRIFLAVLVAAMRETGPVQEYGRAARCPGRPAGPGPAQRVTAAW